MHHTELREKGLYEPAVITSFAFYMGFGFGCAWELQKGVVNFVANGNYMSYSIVDALTDIHMDFVGALMVAALAYIILRRQSTEELVVGINEQKILYNLTRKEKEGMN